VRLSAFLLVLSVAGVVGGAWLIGMWAVGTVVVAMSGGLGAYAVLRDVPEKTVRGDQLDLIRNRRVG
jgi:amino acid transporter